MRLEVLDGLRGVAALVVVLYHFVEHYGVSYRNAVFAKTGLELFNGPASVVTFFVLSGFVLTVAVNDDPRGDRLVNAVLRRWPRLAAPVLVAGLLLSLGSLLHLYPSPTTVPDHSINANSSILEGFNRHAESVVSVVEEAVIGAFVSPTPHYNLVLWTMHFELLGSFLVFAVATAGRFSKRLLRYGAMTALGGGSLLVSPWLVPFAFGITLCHAWQTGWFKPIRLPPAVLLGILILCLLVFATVGPNMTLSLAAGHDKLAVKYAWMIAQSLAASVLLILAFCSDPVRRVLTHPICATLGRLSFAVYLTHLTVLFSASAWLWLLGAPAPVNLVMTLALSYAVAAPLAAFDRWWLDRLRVYVRVPVTDAREPEGISQRSLHAAETGHVLRIRP